MIESPPTAQHQSRKSRLRRSLGIVVSLAIIGGIFVGVLPRIADLSEVWASIRAMTWLEIASLLAVTVWNIVTYWPVMVSSLPGLTYSQAAVVNQSSTAIANTIPGGGVIAIGVTYAMFTSWGFSTPAIALFEIVTGIWNNFMKLTLPVVALALLAFTGKATGALILASVIGIAVLVGAVVLLFLVLWKERFARAVGSVMGRGASRVLGWMRRGPVETWGEAAVRFRAQTIDLVRTRWVIMSVATVVSHLSLFLVLLVALRHLGVSEQEVSWVQALGVFAFVRLISALPITPGGLGVVELGYIGGLVLAGGDREQVVAAVLVFRVLTYLLQIPLGALAYVVWQRKRGWRRAPVVEPSMPGAAARPTEREVAT